VALHHKYPTWNIAGTRYGPKGDNSQSPGIVVLAGEDPKLTLLDNVDATKLHAGAYTAHQGELFDTIIWNNSYPDDKTEHRDVRAAKAALLIGDFVSSARQILKPGGILLSISTRDLLKDTPILLIPSKIEEAASGGSSDILSGTLNLRHRKAEEATFDSHLELDPVPGLVLTSSNSLGVSIENFTALLL